MGAWGQEGLTNNPSCPHAPEFNRHGALAGRGRRLVPNLFSQFSSTAIYARHPTSGARSCPSSGRDHVVL